MLNLIITWDDPTERLLYGAPDPYLALFECRHDVDYQHHHNEVNPPTGPGGPKPPEPPDPDPDPGPGPDPHANPRTGTRAGTRADAGTDSRVAEPA